MPPMWPGSIRKLKPTRLNAIAYRVADRVRSVRLADVGLSKPVSNWDPRGAPCGRSHITLLPVSPASSKIGLIVTMYLYGGCP